MEKLKNIKIAFVDIDGTLSNSRKKITNETSNSIKRATDKGLKVILCSGRGNLYVKRFSRQANASNYIIACNGAEIFDYSNDSYINSIKLNFTDIKTIWDYCNQNGICCILNGKDFRYCNNYLFIPEEDKIKVDDINQIKNINIYQIVAGSKDYDTIHEMDLFIDKIDNLKIVNASSFYINKNKEGNHYFLDITNKCVSKGDAIKKVLDYFNLRKENAVSFGDHINDYDLFDEVGFKIAMKNANYNLKEKADYITLSNDENGVAYFLDNFIDYNK